MYMKNMIDNWIICFAGWFHQFSVNATSTRDRVGAQGAGHVLQIPGILPIPSIVSNLQVGRHYMRQTVHNFCNVIRIWLSRKCQIGIRIRLQEVKTLCSYYRWWKPVAWVTSPYRKSAYPNRKWPNTAAARMPRPQERTAPNSNGSTAINRSAGSPIQLSSISGRSNSGTKIANVDKPPRE